MEKILCNTTNTMQKMDTPTKEKISGTTFYRVKLFDRANRHDARISLPIFKTGVNPRLSASSSTSKEEAVLKLLEKIKAALINGINEKTVSANNLFFIFLLAKKPVYFT